MNELGDRETTEIIVLGSVRCTMHYALVLAQVSLGQQGHAESCDLKPYFKNKQCFVPSATCYLSLRCTVLAVNFAELQLLRRYLDTQQIRLQHPKMKSNCFNT